MEEAMVSPMISSALNFLALGLSVVLLFVAAYLWSSNSTKSAQIAQLQSDVQTMKRKLNRVEEKVNQFKEPTVVSEVPQVEPFGLDLSEPRPLNITPLAPQDPWMDFVAAYNKLAIEMMKPGQLTRCEQFVREQKLRALTYGGSMTFRPAIDVRDSSYWAFKLPGAGEEFAVVPNPMNPCDEELHDHGGLKEIFALNYQGGTYKKYSVKLPAIFEHDHDKGWTLKNPGVVNLERK